MEKRDDYPRVAGSADGDGCRAIPLSEAAREGFQAVSPAAARTFDENEHSRRYAATDILVALIANRTRTELSLDQLLDRAFSLAERIYPVSLETAADPEPAAREDGAAAERARIRQMALEPAEALLDVVALSLVRKVAEMYGDREPVKPDLTLTRVLAKIALRDFAALLEKP